LKKIIEVSATKMTVGNRCWRGKIIIQSIFPYTGLSLVEFSRYMKKMLREKYPLAKNSITFQRSKVRPNRFNFYITFTDDAEEAEFIMTIKTLEGLEL